MLKVRCLTVPVWLPQVLGPKVHFRCENPKTNNWDLAQPSEQIKSNLENRGAEYMNWLYSLWLGTSSGNLWTLFHTSGEFLAPLSNRALFSKDAVQWRYDGLNIVLMWQLNINDLVSFTDKWHKLLLPILHVFQTFLLNSYINKDLTGETTKTLLPE